jgi:hypothetical protein
MEFGGFVPPKKNYFPMPNEWTDITAEIDNLAELKVVEYVLRHTWGFQEFGIAKTISVDEFMHGRKRADGSRMDKGTKLSEQSVRNGLTKAIEDGFLICEVNGNDQARVKKSYKLKMVGQEAQELEVKTLDPLKARGQKARPRSTKSLTPEPQTLDPGVPKVRPRTEKETIERHQKNTKERETPATPTSPAPAQSSLSPSSQNSSHQKKSVQVVHPLHSFLLLDDAIAPTTLTILLTSKEYESELEDDRRMRIAEEVQWDLEARGHIVQGVCVREHEQKVVDAPPTSLLERLTDAQADFWRRWCALSHCGDDALTEKLLPDIAWLAERVTTTSNLESLYRSNATMLLELSRVKETQYTPPHLKNLIKHYPTWASAQDAKQKQREQSSPKTVSGTGAVKNWTLARLSGQMDAPPVVYPDAEPKKTPDITESMGIKKDLAAMLEKMRG